jgi:hypothetical protein
MAKRPVPEDFVVSPPPAKKARKYEPKRLYTVKVTHYTDDYKARGSDWASSEDVGAFRSRKRANRCEEDELLKFVREQLEERGQDDEKYAQYWTAQEDEDEKSLDDDLIKEDLYELGERFAEGEFVPRTFSVDIETTCYDDRASDEESL